MCVCVCGRGEIGMWGSGQGDRDMGFVIVPW